MKNCNQEENVHRYAVSGEKGQRKSERFRGREVDKENEREVEKEKETEKRKKQIHTTEREREREREREQDPSTVKQNITEKYRLVYYHIKRKWMSHRDTAYLKRK